MTNKINPTAYLDEPPNTIPIQNSQTGELSPYWERWFNDVATNFSFGTIHDRFDDTKKETAVNRILEFTETQRDLLQNAQDGVVVYNTTTNRFNFRENGAWVTFTAIPA